MIASYRSTSGSSHSRRRSGLTAAVWRAGLFRVNLGKSFGVGNAGDEARATNPSNYRIINGSADLLTFGKGPKEYTDSKFIVMVNDYFGPFVGYEWGSLPPVYKFVDHKWTFGVLFKSKIKVK